MDGRTLCSSGRLLFPLRASWRVGLAPTAEGRVSAAPAVDGRALSASSGRGMPHTVNTERYLVAHTGWLVWSGLVSEEDKKPVCRHLAADAGERATPHPRADYHTCRRARRARRRRRIWPTHALLRSAGLFLRSTLS